MNSLALNHRMLSIYRNMRLNYFRIPQRTSHFWPPNTEPPPGTWILPHYGLYSLLRCSQARRYVILLGIGKISLVNKLWIHPTDNKSIFKPQRCITSFNSSKNMKTAVELFFFSYPTGRTKACGSVPSQRSNTWKRPASGKLLSVWGCSLWNEMLNCSLKVPHPPLSSSLRFSWLLHLRKPTMWSRFNRLLKLKRGKCGIKHSG